MTVIANLELYNNNFLLTYRSEQQHHGRFHAHQGMEFIYIYQGTGHVMLDQRIYPLRGGTFVFLQPYQLHCIRQDDSVLYTRSYVVFEPSLFEAYLSMFPALRSFFYRLWKDQLTSQVFYDIREDNPLVQLYSELNERTTTADMGKKTEEYGLYVIRLLSLLRSLWATHEESEFTYARSISQVERIMAWLDEHVDKPLSVTELSKHVHLSPKHISALFRQKTGGTITDYLMAKRLNQACFLLNTTNRPITEIAHNVGFSNTSYFCQFFKKKTGSSPHQYRKRFLELL